MTDSVLKPAEFRPATNYDTNPYYDTNFDHSVVDPLKQIDARLDKDEKDIADIKDDIAGIQEDITEISGSLIFRVVPVEGESNVSVLDKTYADFENAVLAGKPIYGDIGNGYMVGFSGMQTTDAEYQVFVQGDTYSADSKTGTLRTGNK